MKILFLYTVNKSFLSEFFSELSEESVRLGYEVEVWSMKNHTQSYIRNGVKYSIEKKGSKIYKLHRIFSVIKFSKPDIVISNFSYSNSALASSYLLGVKKNIVWMHTLSEQLNNNMFQRVLKSFFLNLSQKIIVNSPLLKNDLREKYGIRRVPIFTLPFWSSMRSQPKALTGSIVINRIGCPGRLEDTKNQEFLLDWLYQSKNFTNYTLYFAGGGINVTDLKKKVRLYGLDSRVEFMGTLGMDQMKAFYEDMDLIVLPSQFESFGLVLVESLSLNKPTLVSKAFGALSYVKDEGFKDNFTFNPNDIDDFNERLGFLESNTSLKSFEFYDIYRTYFDKELICQKFLDIIHK